MSDSDIEIAVIGAGVAGLAAARQLTAAGRDVRVFEAAERVGGAAHTVRTAGYLVERGANTFRVPPVMVAFLEAMALRHQLAPAAPTSRLRFLLRGGDLVPLPQGLLSALRTPLLSARGKLRLLAEPFVPRARSRDRSDGESAADFAARRFGRETHEALLAPFLTGVYAGDPHRLGAEVVFPTLVAAERRWGSVALGLLLGRRGGPRALPGSWSAVGGSGGLARALAENLQLRFSTPVRRIVPEVGAFQLHCDAAQHRARSVVIATPPAAAASLLDRAAPDAAVLLRDIPTVPVASLSLGLAPTDTVRPIEGFGYLVPQGEAELVLGCLFPSQLFSDRAPPGRELLTALVAGGRNPQAVDWPEDRLREHTARDLDAALGLRGEPEWLGTARWPRAIAQPGPDHLRRISALRQQLSPWPRLALAGAYLEGGIALGAALCSGLEAAARLGGGESAPRGGLESPRPRWVNFSAMKGSKSQR